MPLIACLETATRVCSVALSQDGKVIASKEIEHQNSHASSLTNFLDEVLEQASLQSSQLEAIAVSGGPGSYTGIRIGMSVAKGLCYGLQKPLIKIGTLESMANGCRQQLEREKPCLLIPMIDARRMEVFTAIFDEALQSIENAHPLVIDEQSFEKYIDSGKEMIFFGTGAQKCEVPLAHLKATFLPAFKCSAKYLASLAEQKFKNKEFENLSLSKADYFKDFYTIPSKKGLLK